VATAYIALGANLGDRAETLRRAVGRLATLGRITAVSSLYETDPVGYQAQPTFLNAVVALETTLPPGDLLSALLGIERELGRTRTFRNAPRTLDLDLLLANDVVLTSDELTLPHPRLHDRAFVLVPLGEIAPEVMQPKLRKSISDLLLALPDRGGVRLYALPGWERAPKG
jgi:2-amino-4-hydroxy-6-hydroxymethyldihydropteridine diphosphokinase